MPLIVHQPTLKHYVDLLTQTNFLTWTYNTMLVAVVTTAVSLVLGAMIGYPWPACASGGGRGGHRRRGYLSRAAAAPVHSHGGYHQPSRARQHPHRRHAHVSDAPHPFCAWLLMGYFKSVPRELEEAARIDGASRVQAMTRVVLPLCTPGLLSAGIFAFTLAQNEFLYASSSWPRAMSAPCPWRHHRADPRRRLLLGPAHGAALLARCPWHHLLLLRGSLRGRLTAGR